MSWIQNNPPKLEDGEVYDIRLMSGRIVKSVEYWEFGGGFKPKRIGTGRNKLQLVEYKLRDVSSFRLSESK